MSTLQTDTLAPKAEPRPSNTVWQNRSFLILFLSGAVISFGSKVYELALPLIIYQMTHSSVYMATMRAIEFLPNLLLAMFIGVLVDRFNKKRWTQTMVFLQAVILLALFLLVQFGKASLLYFYIAGFFLMTCNYGYGNARVSIVKLAVPKHLLTSANAKFSLIWTLIDIMGPAISGIILMFSALHNGLLITACSFSLALLLLSFLDTDSFAPAAGRSAFLQEFREGWQELLANRPLWLITLLVIFLNATAGMFDAMVVFFAKDHLHLANSQLGMVLSSAGLGGLAGSMLVELCRKYIPTGRLLGITILSLGAAYLVMVLADSAWLMCVSLFFTGMIGTIENICIWTYRQETTPSHLIGRISGITGSIFKLGMVFTIYGSGWIAETLGTKCVFLGAAVSNLLIFLVYRRLSLWGLK
ncbi:MFS transporter [Brevibacillus sp. SYP-B805]|uniref:MFS transporter n=1 Tax=Brevibacillus sp. SYP-B805 TaxID=1578199 RepID=UPI0013E9E47F|nr:MFS transporter [Brevibacillus sp. SYP-B805]NGQ95965.1 MFS transporter [Brevibacillus sp. SYP-B805]